MKFYRFVRDVPATEYSSFPKDFKEGDIVYPFLGCDYGCVKDDYNIGKVKTVVCTLNNQGGSPFFTIPIDMIVDDEGNHPEFRY